MASSVYLLCTLTSLTCFVMLARAWLGSRSPLLFWSALCFAGMTINNVLLVLDKLVFPAADLSAWRLLTALAAIMVLLFGLVWEEE